MDKTEQWALVQGYDGRYSVSSAGRVKRMKWAGCRRTYRERALKPGINSSGYYGVVLTKGEDRRWIGVHRLVAAAFIDNPARYPFVHHINHNKRDNRRQNLQWCTHQQNSEHARVFGAYASGADHANAVPVRCFDPSGKLVGEYPTLTAAARATGLPYATLTANSRNGRPVNGYTVQRASVE